MILRSSRNVRTVLIATVAAGALVLSACGSDTATTASSTTSAPATSAATSAASSAADTATESSSAGSSSASSAAAGPTTASADDIAAATAGLIASGKLTVCTSLSYPPFEAADIDGKVTGFDIDFMDLIGTALGVEVSVIDTPFEGIKSGQAMASKSCDIAASAMTITPERQAAILFSDPYYDASQAMMVLSASTATGLKDLSGKTIGAQSGTTGETYAQAHAAEFGYSVTLYQSITDEEQALQSGGIDAAIHDEPALNDYLAGQSGAVKIVANFDTGEQYGFGMALGNTSLAAVTNAVLSKSHADGTYDASFTKWIKAGNS